MLDLPAAGPLKWLDVIETPAVLIDLDVVEANILRCQAHCSELGFKMRPHIKTHKLPMLAHAQLAAGAIGVTTQKLGEAEIMADAGIEDILISYNIVGPAKLQQLRRLASRAKVTVVADNATVVSGLSDVFANSPSPLDVLVECDTGMGRCGVLTPQAAVAMALEVAASPGLRFAGLMTYPAPKQGNSAAGWLEEAADLLHAAGLKSDIVSSGGTPDLYAMNRHDSVTEYRPGSYIYNDRSLIDIGACKASDCALTVVATVISSPEPNRTIIDAGTKVLTSDLFGMQHYGTIPEHPDFAIVSLNEEHGRIECPSGNAPAVGELLRIIPNHACVVSNMVDYVHLVRGDNYVRAELVAARGKVE
ncbi:alanine racemase [Mesorhizobium loti]|nr:D-TA family PLP-dependent enzyme [Mesorhizobium loti]PLP59992.1 alanine racemase [Mesorhizobium loti]